METSSSQTEPIHLQPAIVLLVCFASGIMMDRWLDLYWQTCLAASLVAWLIWLAFHIRRKTALGMLALSISLLFAGAFYHHGRWNWFSPQDLSIYCQSESYPVCLRGRILGQGKSSVKPDQDLFNPMPGSERTKFRFQPTSLRVGQRWVAVNGNATLTIYQPVDHVQFGDEVEVFGRMSRIRKPTSPGQFDFQEFYRSKNQTCSIQTYYNESVAVLKSAPQYSNAFFLSRLRSCLDNLLHHHVGSGQSGFASAILLGNREQLTTEKRDRFLTTGTAHLLAISGLHVGILASIFLIAYRLSLISRRWALLLTIIFVLFYAWLVEFRPPVSRAAILLTLFCVGRLIGKKGSDFGLLALAGFVVLVINPNDLFRLGPQLSFLAFATIILFKDWVFPPLSDDPIERLIRNTRPKPVRIANRLATTCKQAVIVSGLIWLIGLPLVAHNFHLVTPVALAINPFVLLPVGVALFSGLGVCVFGLWFPLAAEFCGSLCGYSLHFVSSSIQTAENIRWGHWWTAGPTQLAIWIFYLALLGLAILQRHKLTVRSCCLVWCGWVLFAWMIPFQLDKYLDQRKTDQGQLTFLDVGHGSSVVVQLPGGQTMLYDAGSLVSASFAAETVSNLLWEEQIEHLDCIVISHADLDHLNAIPTLVKRFSVGQIYVSVPMVEQAEQSDIVKTLFAEIRSKGVEITRLGWGDLVQLDCGDTSIEVLSPPDFGTASNNNSDSIVLLVDIEGKKVLLPGDLEKTGLQLLLTRKRIDCHLAMLPHHGSKNSRPCEFVRWCQPEAVVVSSSGNRTAVSVVNEVGQMNCSVLATAKLGSIRTEIGSAKQQSRISHWNGSQWVKLHQK